ncbi:MAG: RHS repeat domain-containing protein [Acidobacteriota bacterium]
MFSQAKGATFSGEMKAISGKIPQGGRKDGEDTEINRGGTEAAEKTLSSLASTKGAGFHSSLPNFLTPSQPFPQEGQEDGEAIVFDPDGTQGAILPYSPTPLLTYSHSSPTIRYYACDHLGTPRLIMDEQGAALERRDFEPFGVQLEPHTPAIASSRFTVHERDEATSYDYMHARFYALSLGRFMKPDVIPGKPGDPQSWNLYTYVRGNPVNLVDPLGLDWYQINGKWEWRKGSGDVTWKDSQGKEHTAKGYTHLMVVTFDYKDKNGVSHYKVALYNQNSKAPVATGTAFSGGANGANAVRSGNYFILNRQDPPPTYVQSRDADRNPPASYGIQNISRAPLPSDGPADPNYYDAWSAYGPTRARLNPLDGQPDRGAYYHGQQPTRGEFLGTTHGCLSYGQDDSVMQAIISTNRNVPVSIDTPVEFPW